MYVCFSGGYPVKITVLKVRRKSAQKIGFRFFFPASNDFMTSFERNVQRGIQYLWPQGANREGGQPNTLCSPENSDQTCFRCNSGRTRTDEKYFFGPGVCVRMRERECCWWSFWVGGRSPLSKGIPPEINGLQTRR